MNIERYRLPFELSIKEGLLCYLDRLILVSVFGFGGICLAASIILLIRQTVFSIFCAIVLGFISLIPLTFFLLSKYPYLTSLPSVSSKISFHSRTTSSKTLYLGAKNKPTESSEKNARFRQGRRRGIEIGLNDESAKVGRGGRFIKISINGGKARVTRITPKSQKKKSDSSAIDLTAEAEADATSESSSTSRDVD